MTLHGAVEVQLPDYKIAVNRHEVPLMQAGEALLDAFIAIAFDKDDPTRALQTFIEVPETMPSQKRSSSDSALSHFVLASHRNSPVDTPRCLEPDYAIALHLPATTFAADIA
jgi:hypothetical protein